MIVFVSEFGREFDKSDQIGYRNLSHDFAQNQENLAGLPHTIATRLWTEKKMQREMASA